MADESYVLRCGHCGNTTAFNERAEYHYDERIYDKDDDGNPIYWGHYVVKRVEWRILQCPACKNPTLHQLLGPGDERGGWDDEPYATVWYPQEKTMSRDLPQDVAIAYREARRIAPLSPSACAVMMGRTLKTICRREGAVGRNLQQRLENLATSGHIPDTLGTMAQQLRQIRNLGAHADATGDEVKESDIPVILDFMDAILEYLYVAPARITALEARLNHKGK
jgi:uncharacterized protein DUF4145